MPRRHVKNLLAHTVGRSQNRRHPIEQFSVSGLLAGGGTGNSGSSQTSLSGLTGGPQANVSQQIVELSKHLNDLRQAQQTAIDTTNENTRALIQNTVRRSSVTSTSPSTTSLLTGLFGSGLSPIIKGILSLFGGSSNKTVQPLVPFTLPPAINYEGGYSANNGGQVAPVNYGQNGGTRVSTQGQATNVQIQVNAMDSRSFLDHSADIARAVREAMLHSNSLNDVVADL